jgi:hypothetical protein
MAIVAAHSVASFFSEAVEDSIRSRRLEATDGATRYIVALLADYAHPARLTGETLERPLTLLFDEAVHAPDAADRFGRLRALGDGVLYGCGFFGDHFESRGVDRKYLHAIGTRAYESAGVMLRRHPVREAHDGGPESAGLDLFGELASKFAAFVEIVSDVADGSIAMGAETARGLVKAYERWLKTGSERLASALTAQGVVPTRGPKGTLQ